MFTYIHIYIKCSSVRNWNWNLELEFFQQKDHENSPDSKLFMRESEMGSNGRAQLEMVELNSNWELCFMPLAINEIRADHFSCVTDQLCGAIQMKKHICIHHLCLI